MIAWQSRISFLKIAFAVFLLAILSSAQCSAQGQELTGSPADQLEQDKHEERRRIDDLVPHPWLRVTTNSGSYAIRIEPISGDLSIRRPSSRIKGQLVEVQDSQDRSYRLRTATPYRKNQILVVGEREHTRRAVVLLGELIKRDSDWSLRVTEWYAGTDISGIGSSTWTEVFPDTLVFLDRVRSELFYFSIEKKSFQKVLTAKEAAWLKELPYLSARLTTSTTDSTTGESNALMLQVDGDPNFEDPGVRITDKPFVLVLDKGADGEIDWASRWK